MPVESGIEYQYLTYLACVLRTYTWESFPPVYGQERRILDRELKHSAQNFGFIPSNKDLIREQLKFVGKAERFMQSQIQLI